MGSKVFYSGLFIFLALGELVPTISQAQLIGAIVMVVGLILMWANR